TDWGPKEAVGYYHWDHKSPGNKWVKATIWGGTFFQHCVQAIAADIMANGMLKAENYGYKTIFTVHDEAVALVEALTKFNYKEYEKILCDLPTWADGLLLIAEGWEGMRYKK
ncbi:MAG: hypothetical protein OQL19_21675, partial [Gammaproteobacteria bacterium]|nr:hypothetical protein [Gammaproteobacteria bacterium]